jgi:hypothetical protein
MSPEELEELLAALSDKATMARLRNAESQVTTDDVRSAVAVRSLRARS